MNDSLIAEAEKLTDSMHAGHLTREQAAHRLQQYADGGLTRVGARDLIDRWPDYKTWCYHLAWCRTCRTTYGTGQA